MEVFVFLRLAVLIILSTSFANAQESSGVMDSARSALDKASGAVANLNTVAESFYQRTFGGRIDAGLSRLSAASGGLTGDTVQMETASNRVKELAAIRAKEGVKAAEAMEAASNAVSEAGRSASNAYSIGKQQTVDATKQAAIAAQLNLATSLNFDFSRLVWKSTNVNDTIKAIEQKLDQSVMNAYLQQKMARLLSSDNLCTAAKSCTDNKGKNKATFNMNDLKDIFPNSGPEIRGAKGTKSAGSSASSADGTNK